MEQLKNITYKHTAAGFLPKEWEVNNLEKIAEFRNGKAHENIVDSEGKYIIINSKFISTEGEVAKYSKEILCPMSKGEIVMVMSDVPNGKAIAKCFYVKEDNLYTLNQRICAITAKKVDPKFLYYALNRNKYYLTFDDGVNQTNLRKEEVLECPIPLPPLPEQIAIAQVLSTADAAIHTTEKLIAQKELRKKWLMQQLLTGKKRLMGFSGEWRKVGAGEIFKSITKKGFADEELLSATQDRGMIPRTMLEGRVTMPTSGTEGFKLVEVGDFIISLRSFQGGLEYSYYRGLVSPAYTVLKPKKPINDEFYKQYFKRYEFIGRLATAVIGIRDGKQISYDDFCIVKIPNPTLEEQTAIAQVLQVADAEISLLKTKVEMLREKKKGLMQQLLTGKVRVKIKE